MQMAMVQMKAGRAVRLLLAAILAMLMLAGCAGTTGSKQKTLTPLVEPDTILQSGVLLVGVDSTRSPYAGTSKGKIVGIDVDVASALAEQLGLKIQIVDTAGLNADELLASGTVDVIMDVEQSGATVTQGEAVGPYVMSGPALFTKIRTAEVPTIDLAALGGSQVVTQTGSLSEWTVNELLGKGSASAVASLADALQQVGDGTATYAAGDAVIGSYLAIEYDNVACVKMLGTPIGVYCAVKSDNVALAEKLAEAMRVVRDTGKMNIILSKWLGPVSAAVVSTGTNALTAQDASAVGTAAAAVDPASIDTGDDLPDPSLAGGTE